MIKGSVPYTLCRIEDDSSLTPVSRHGDFLTGIAAAGHAVEVEDFDFAYALYSGDPANGSATRVASFREGRIGYRLWAMKTGRINPSIEDRYDHDVDELMA
jgi:hypothetical protein